MRNVACMLISRPELAKAAICGLEQLQPKKKVIGLAPRLYNSSVHDWLDEQPNTLVAPGTDSDFLMGARKRIYDIALRLEPEWIVNFDDDDILVNPYAALRLASVGTGKGMVHGDVLRVVKREEGLEYWQVRQSWRCEKPKDANCLYGSLWAISAEAWEKVSQVIDAESPDLYFSDYRIAYWARRLGFEDTYEPGIASVERYSLNKYVQRRKERRFDTWEGLVKWMDEREP